MVLVYYIIAFWLVAAYLITHIQKNEVIRSIIMYFVFTMLLMSTYSLIYLNYRLVLVTLDKQKYLSFLISRDAVIPFLTVISINFFYRLTEYKRVLSLVVLISFIALIELINLKLQLISYVKWSFGLMLLVYTSCVMITLIVGKYINVLQLRSVKK